MDTILSVAGSFTSSRVKHKSLVEEEGERGEESSRFRVPLDTCAVKPCCLHATEGLHHNHGGIRSKLGNDAYLSQALLLRTLSLVVGSDRSV